MQDLRLPRSVYLGNSSPIQLISMPVIPNDYIQIASHSLVCRLLDKFAS
jgi:hypothetical protein